MQGFFTTIHVYNDMLQIGSGGRILTDDLNVMSVAS
jgi:hypothetical protein